MTVRKAQTQPVHRDPALDDSAPDSTAFLRGSTVIHNLQTVLSVGDQGGVQAVLSVRVLGAETGWELRAFFSPLRLLRGNI